MSQLNPQILNHVYYRTQQTYPLFSIGTTCPVHVSVSPWHLFLLKFRKTIITMLTYSFVSLMVISLVQASRISLENSIEGPYVAGGENLAYWDLTGSAQLEEGHIRLTPDEPYRHGAVWNNFPTISNSWEYQVFFQIHGKGVHLHGDGMALWYVRESDMLHNGPVFGSKDYFSGLGIFIDTFEDKDEPHKQHRHPYISAMVNNGSLHYEHYEDGTMTQIGGCHAAVRNLEAPTKIAVSYINEELSVYFDNEGLRKWKLCFTAEGIHLPSGYHFGISASTGENSDNHDIVAVRALNMDPPDMDLMDKTGILPEAENIQIPFKYHKEFIEQESQVEKREANDESLKVEKREANDDESLKVEKREANDDESLKVEKREDNDESLKVEKREAKDDDDDDKKEDNDEGGEEESKPQKLEFPEKKEIDSSQTTIWRKLIYMTGSIIILLISVSTFKKYYERRKERLHKRMF